MNRRELRRKRMAAGIPGRLLCAKVGIDRSKLSDIERTYIEPSSDESIRINRAIDELIEAKEKVERVAAEAGWPMA